MHKRLIICTLCTLAPAIVPSATLAGGPTQAQVRAAVTRAEHSPQLWATVNICNTRQHRHMIGIRGEIPALGFPSRLSIQVEVYYWSKVRHHFQPDPEAARLLELGRFSQGFHQGGVTYQFEPPQFLRGHVTFQWTRNGRVIGHTTRWTAGGHKPVDYGDPPGYSAAYCRITQQPAPRKGADRS